MRRLGTASGRLAGVLWPVRCAGCGRPDEVLCPGCRGWAGAVRRCPVAGCAVPVWAVAAYGGPARGLVVQWKERGRLDLTPPLATELARALRACLASPDLGPGAGPVLLVPVAASAAGLRRRGADLVADLARSAVRALPTRLEPPVEVRSVLRVRRRVRDQSGLDVAQRRANLAGAIGLRPRVRATGALVGRVVVLVDDVVTTGATLDESVRTLEAAGARVVAACCLCVTLRRRGVPKSRSQG